MTAKERYWNRKAKGLCAICGKRPPVNNKIRCQECIDYMVERTEWLESHGICHTCGNEIVKEGCKQCRRCLANNNVARIEYKPETADQKTKRSIKGKSLYNKRKEQGLCTRCGQRKPADGKLKCGICLAKDSSIHKNSAYKKGSIPTELRGDGLYCYHCCQPKCNGTKVCEDCRIALSKNAEIMRQHIDRENHIWRKLQNTEINELAYKKNI